MSLVGLCSRRSRNSNVANSSKPSNIMFEAIDIKEEEVEAGSIHFNLLEVVKSSDWSDISYFKNCWMGTYEQRQEIFSQTNTLDYLTLFPYMLQSDVGYELVRNNLLYFKNMYLSLINRLLWMLKENFLNFLTINLMFSSHVSLH